MNLVAYTATALSRNDIEDTPTNKNIVDGAIVELKDLDGNLVVIYDDAAGTNPETQKSCDTNGQLTFWVVAGNYVLFINGAVNYVTISNNNASSINNGNGGSVQDFIDSFALKIFQSPTDGGLTEIQTRTVGAGEVYEVRKTSGDSLATIYSDAAGTTEIVQDGTSNASDSAGVVDFYIDGGDYYVDYMGVLSYFTNLNNPLDIRAFGADGTEVNDTQALQQASLKGRPHIPKGVWVFSSSVDIWATGFTSDSSGVSVATDGLTYDVSNSILGRFCWATDSENKFLYLINRDDGINVMTLARGNASDASTFADSLQCRKNGHTLLSTAGTVGGSTDIDFRTSGSSDYAYIQAVSTYGNTNLLTLIDTKPARPDGTKKDGTGGGGQLDPAEDVYTFDATIQMRSNVSPTINNHETCLRFPVAPGIFEQGYGVRRRGLGDKTYWTTFDGSDNAKKVCVESGSVLESYEPNSTRQANIVRPSASLDLTSIYACSDGVDSNRQIRSFEGAFGNTSITTGGWDLRLVSDGVVKLAKVKASIYTSGGVVYYFEGKASISGSTVSVVGSTEDTTPAQITPSFLNDGGGMIFRISYSGGLGVSVKALVKYEIL